MATTAQYASRVAESKVAFTKAVEDMEGCGFGYQEPNFVCIVQLNIGNTVALTIKLELEGAQEPGNPTYIGEPPIEIKDLVSKTLSGAVEVAKLFGDTKGCVDDPTGSGCNASLGMLYLKMVSYSESLTAWGPYGA